MTDIAVSFLDPLSTGLDKQNEREANTALEIAKLSVVKHLLHYRLHHDGTYIGVLHMSVNPILHALEEIGDIEWYVEGEAISLQRAFQKAAKRTLCATDSGWRLNINLTGPLRLKHQVGAVLQQGKTHLQIPKYMPHGLRLENPHIIEFPGLEVSLESAVDEGSNKLKTTSSPTNITDILENLDHSVVLQTTRDDCQLITPLQKYIDLWYS